MCPYIDLGSIAFENPEVNGYKLLYPTLKDQIKGFERPLWKYYLNYETLNFNRDQIVFKSYEQGKILNHTKYELGAITQEQERRMNMLLNLSFHLSKIIDEYLASNKSETEINERIKYGFNVKNTMIMKREHDMLAKALGRLNLMKHGVKFAQWRIKHLIETKRLFYNK